MPGALEGITVIEYGSYQAVPGGRRDPRGHGVFFHVVRTPSDAVEDPQALANGLFVKVPHPVLGEMTTLASPATFHDTPALVRSCAPEAGQHTEELLIEVGYDWDDIQALREQGIIR